MILENGGIFGLDYGLISRLREPNNAGDGEDCVTVLSVDKIIWQSNFIMAVGMMIDVANHILLFVNYSQKKHLGQNKR